MGEAAVAAQAAVGGFFRIKEDLNIFQSVVTTEMNKKEIQKAMKKAKNNKIGRSVTELLNMKK